MDYLKQLIDLKGFLNKQEEIPSFESMIHFMIKIRKIKHARQKMKSTDQDGLKIKEEMTSYKRSNEELEKIKDHF